MGTSSGTLLYYSETKNWKNGASSPVYLSSADYDYADSYQAQSYQWRDGAVQASVSLTNRDGASTSSYSYDRDGSLHVVGITGGTRPRQIVYTTDLAGQILGRGEYDTHYSQNDPHNRTWMFGGRQMGQVGNDGTGNTDYATSIAERTQTPGSGAFRNGGTSASLHADFDANFTALNGSSAGGGGSSYTASSGDTLQGIAQAVWGDANLWYKLAEANGLAGGASLSAGQSLIIPGGVMGTHHNADTFKPYDPADAIGNTSPNTPKPPKQGNKCGAFGQILVTVVAVAVAALAQQYEVFAALGPVLGGAATGAAASIVSQGVGVAVGAQDGFSWKGVGLAAIAGGVAGGLGPKGAFGADGAFSKAGSEFATQVLRGAVGSAVGQGIGLATGLQSKFDFAGVAAAGVGAGVANIVGGQLGGKFGNAIGSFGRDLVANTARGIANAATRSAINGNSFGDNLMRALPDIIGQTLGNAAARGGAALARAVEESVTANPSGGGGQTAGQGAEIVVTGNYDLSGLGSRSSFGLGDFLPTSGAVGDRIFGAAAQSLIGSDGRALSDINWSTTMQAFSDQLGPNGSYKGGDKAVAGASFLDHARAMYGVSAKEMVDFAGALGRDSLFNGVTDPAKIMDIGAGYGRQIVAEGFGLRGGSRDPDGLVLAELVLRSYAANPIYGPGFAAAADQVAQASAALNREANAIDRDIGGFVRFSGSTAIAPLGLVDVAYSLYRGDITPQQLIAGGLATTATTLILRKPIGAITAKFGAAESRILTQSHPDFIGPREFVGPLPAVAFSKARTPGIANNIEAGIANGHPSVLTRIEGRDAIRAQRADALAGQARPPSGYSLDEFPFASTRQGGAGAQVAQVPVIEQNIQGGMLSSFYQKYGITHGAPFKVIVVP